MIAAQATQSPPTTAIVEVMRRRLYDAECALHSARQTQVDLWISAAANRLHEAFEDLERAEASTRLARPGNYA
jgi:hypothetical protein